jgi:hypothetical protein
MVGFGWGTGCAGGRAEREAARVEQRMGGTSDGDIDTAIDTVTRKKSYGVVVPPYRNLANTQTST